MYLSPINYQSRVMNNKQTSFSGGKNVFTTKVIELGKDTLTSKVVLPAGIIALGIQNSQDKKNTSLNIIRFKNIDDTLYRGGKPNSEEFKQLKEMGINTIIDFTTGYGLKENETSEKAIVEEMGMNYINMPFPSFENPPKEYVEKFFEVMQNARDNNEKVYIHCRHGKDRTGLFAAMYKLKYNIDDIDTCIQEMLDMGHDSINNPNIIPFLKDFNSNLSLQKDENKSYVDAIDKNTELFNKKFLNSKDSVEMTQILLQRYPELYWLTGDVNATPEWQVNNSSGSVSEKLFGKKHVEFDRTIVGIECLKFVVNNEYDKFTECQKETVKMTPDNFKKLRDFTLNVIKTPQDMDTILAYTVINDLGKIKEFVETVETSTNQKTKDHDEALLLALKTMPDKIPSFNRLSENNKNDIINALDADFNLAQFVQGECLPGNLSKIKTINNHAMNLYLAHVFYDVAGAAGHVASNGSLVMNNNVFNGYMQGIESVKENALKGELETYDSFLSKKAQDYNLPISTKEEKAIVRLAIMSRAATPKDALQILDAFQNLSVEEQKNLLNGLAKDGISENGILLYYSPAFIQNMINANPDMKTQMLTKAYSVMSKIYSNNENKSSEEKVKVISLANIASAIKTNPNLTTEQLYAKL